MIATLSAALPECLGARFVAALNKFPSGERERLIEAIQEMQVLASEMPPLHAVLSALVVAELYLPDLPGWPWRPKVGLQHLRENAIEVAEAGARR